MIVAVLVGLVVHLVLVALLGRSARRDVRAVRQAYDEERRRREEIRRKVAGEPEPRPALRLVEKEG